jgi:hypothetical protein
MAAAATAAEGADDQGMHSTVSISKPLQSARKVAVEFAAILTVAIMFDGNAHRVPAEPWVRLVTSQDTSLLLLAVLGIVIGGLHQRQHGRSTVPPPADAWSSSSSGGAIIMEPADNRQQRRQPQQRQQQQQGSACACRPTTSHCSHWLA